MRSSETYITHPAETVELAVVADGVTLDSMMKLPLRSIASVSGRKEIDGRFIISLHLRQVEVTVYAATGEPELTTAPGKGKHN